MYTITAEVINAFNVPASEKYPESWKLQLIGDTFTNDGQLRKEMVTLSIPKDEFFRLKDCVGQTVSLPVNFFVRGNQLNPFYPKASQPSREGLPRGTSADA
jgi:hypothetical protein